MARTIPPLIRFTLVETVPVASVEWEAWRNEQDKERTVGGRTFAQVSGHGYKSASEAYREFLQLTTSPKSEWREAMDHGKNKEPLVQAAIKFDDDLSDNIVEEPASYKYEMSVRTGSKKYEFHAIASPDLYVTMDQSIYEIKCPFYKMKDYDDPLAFRKWWGSSQASFGKTQYFLQALWYWYLLTNGTGEEISVVVAFFGLDDSFCYSKYVYHLSNSDIRDRAINFIEDVLVKLAVATPETYPKRMTKKEKEMADKMAALSYQFRHDSEEFYYSNNVLYKERENQSRDDTSDIPWYKCFPEGLCASI